MLNDTFKKNWLKIIEYNCKVDLSKDTIDEGDMVRIPLTPFKINARILYHLFELLYPQFINDQQNILDLVISDDGENILYPYLYETKKAGIHDSIEKLSLDVIQDNIFPFKKEHLNDLDVYFNKLQLMILERKKVRISSVRIFKEQVFDLIDDLCLNLEDVSTQDFFSRALDFIQNIIEKNLLYLHPKPNILIFIESCLKLINGAKISRIVDLIAEILPPLNLTILFKAKNQYFMLNFNKKVKKSNSFQLLMEFKSPEEYGINTTNLTNIDIINAIYKEKIAKNVYFYDIGNIITLLLDVFEMEIPPSKEKLLLIFQKLLYGFRSFERNWYQAPRIKLFNLKRHVLRSLGINLNIKKLSHWAIPSIMMNLFNSNIGLKSQILIIYTNLDKKNLNSNNYMQTSFRQAMILKFENGTLITIKPIQKSEIFSESDNNSVKNMRSRISKTNGYISAIINIDKNLLSELIDNFVINLTSLKLKKKLKIFKMIKKEQYFNIYPEIPPFKLLKKSGPFSLFKIMTSLLFDKHEF